MVNYIVVVLYVYSKNFGLLTLYTLIQYSLAPVETDDVYPYVLIQSGGVDDAHGNNTELEMALNGASATWEITRYSGKFEKQYFGVLPFWHLFSIL